jgi:hypothetical protein
VADLRDFVLVAARRGVVRRGADTDGDDEEDAAAEGEDDGDDDPTERVGRRSARAMRVGGADVRMPRRSRRSEATRVRNWRDSEAG